MSLTVGVCITTHNRCAELRRTLDALRLLQPPPDEIQIVADGCTDGSIALLNDAAVKVIVHPEARGSIPSRNELAAACTCDLVLSLDDDSYPLEVDFIAQVRALFESQPRLAVACFPQRSEEFPASLEAEDFGPPMFVGSFVNSGAVIRRAVFQELGGYPEHFFHAYEEPDFALRCVAAGWQVRQETSLTVRHHFTAAQRNEVRTHHRHARNEFWSVLLRCPAPQLVAVAIFRALRQLGYAAQRRWLRHEPAWWLSALRGIPRCLAARQPVPWRCYWEWMRLIRQPVASEAEWVMRFGGPAP